MASSESTAADQGAKMLIGESAVSAEPFFASAGRPEKPFWGPQTGPKLILWDSINDRGKDGVREDDASWIVWCRAESKKTSKGGPNFKQHGQRIFSGRCDRVARSAACFLPIFTRLVGVIL